MPRFCSSIFLLILTLPPSLLTWFEIEIVSSRAAFIQQGYRDDLYSREDNKTTNHLLRVFLSKESLLCILLTNCLSLEAYNFTHITLKRCLSSLTIQLFSSILCFFFFFRSIKHILLILAIMVNFLRKLRGEVRNLESD